MDEPTKATEHGMQQSFGARLRRARRVAGLTQEELAEALLRAWPVPIVARGMTAS